MFKLSATLSSGGPWQARVDAIARLPAFRDEPPATNGLDGASFPLDRWVDALKAASSISAVFWKNRRKQITARPAADLTSFTIPDAFSTVDQALAILEPLPFGVCGLGSIFFEEWIAADYERWAFSRGHIDHGWGCVFRGAGHDHLVSRRWLDFGPWRVLRRPDDTTFVQFHDLAITDPALAYDIAKVGHERMGVSHTGGFIQQIYDWMLNDVRGPYDPNERKLEVLIQPNDELPQLRMTNAAALRRHCRLHPDQPQPVDRVAFVFFSDDHARVHLHELWLRDLECWSHGSRGLHRLDLDYHPTPSPPAWVTALEAREAAARAAP